MIYCDTSLIVSALTMELGSSESRHWLADRPRIAISAWVGAEVSAALAGKQRQGIITAAERLRVETAWRLLRTTSFEELDIARDDFEQAERLVDAGRGLRATDALHLAVALRHGCELATRDIALGEAAGASGLKAHLLTGIDSH